jgi:hypothetical protein
MSIANDIKKTIDVASGADVNYRVTGTWYDGTLLNDTRLDQDKFRKLNNIYYKKTIASDLMPKVDTIADLRLYNGYFEGQVVDLLGYYVAGDKDTVRYKFTVANYSTLVDDGGGVIKTDRGSWIAQFGNVIDVRDYGCSESLPDNSTILNTIIQKQSGKEISIGTLNLKFTKSIIINNKIKIRGVVRSSIFDFTGLTPADYAIRTNTTAAINGLEIEGLRVIGAPTVNFIRINQNNNINFSLTDSIFTNLRIEGFNTGLQSNYMWCNTFLNVRFNGCIEPLVLNSQSNQLDFIRCSFVSYKKAIKHTNCEGITYTTCNIANFNLAGDVDATQSFMSLFQSNVTIINPYFELVSSAVLAVGGSSEVNKSSLNILGGKTTDDNVRVKINGNDTKISLKGLNNKNGKDIYVLENAANDIAPTNYVREIYLDNGQTSVNNTLFKFDGNQEWNFTNFGGGAISIRTVNKGFKTIQMNGPANTGVRLTNSLVSGNYYTLVYMINKRAVTGTLRIHHGADYQVLPIQELTDNFEMRYIPFKAMGTNLDLACTVTGDSFDFRYLTIVEGNYIPNSFEKTYIPHFPSIPTSVGNFANGDIVKDSLLGDTYYTLVSGVWQTVKLMKQSAAVTDVTATNSSQVSIADLTSISIADLVTMSTADPTTISTTDAGSTYTTAEQALINELKAKVNVLTSFVIELKAKANLNVTLTNDEKAKINLGVTMSNDIKSKYNTTSTLANSNKTQLNAHMAAERTSGQQAP